VLHAVDRVILAGRFCIDFAAYTANLASALGKQSRALGDLERYDQALAPAAEALAIYRELAFARPGAYGYKPPRLMDDQVSYLAALERNDDILAALSQATIAYRRLPAAGSGTYTHSLAVALGNQSLTLTLLGRHEEALAPMEEAVTVYRELARTRPETFAADLGAALETLSEILAALDRPIESQSARDEATALSLFHPGYAAWISKAWMALASRPARQGQQRSLRRIRHSIC
jgi:tetratricopeptide (TPR) repeat protein